MSEVILDTITGKSTATTITVGSTPVVSASANSLTIRGEGSNQTSIQQGLAKAWLFIEPDNSNLIRDSFNISSFRDGGTGYAGITLATAMGNDDWTCQVTGTGGGTTSGFASLDSGSWGGTGDKPYRTTTQVNCRTTDVSGNYNDHNDLNFLCHGDLA
tara:strand:+ start:633 stop:1106 length:474 start_codon:yes stop_codon:yes gene_type:complete